jgi:hypothetical protein
MKTAIYYSHKLDHTRKKIRLYEEDHLLHEYSARADEINFISWTRSEICLCLFNDAISVLVYCKRPCISECSDPVNLLH